MLKGGFSPLIQEGGKWCIAYEGRRKGYYRKRVIQLVVREEKRKRGERAHGSLAEAESETNSLSLGL